MGAAVEHVEAGNRKQAGGRAPEIPVEGQPEPGGRGPGHRQGHGQDRVGAELRFLGGAIEIEHDLIDRLLARGVEPEDGGSDGGERRCGPPAAHPCRCSDRRRRGVRAASPDPVDAPEGLPPARNHRPQGGLRPRSSDCPESRGSRGRSRQLSTSETGMGRRTLPLTACRLVPRPRLAGLPALVEFGETQIVQGPHRLHRLEARS